LLLRPHPQEGIEGNCAKSFCGEDQQRHGEKNEEDAISSLPLIENWNSSDRHRWR
jgi:hypothetical protein